MTPVDLAEVARQQNDRDFAAGRMPSRYVENVGVLAQVAEILLDGIVEGGADAVA
jgi:hypothetical protein